LVSEAKSENWKGLPIGEQTATAGEALACTRYKRFTLKIHNRIESPSVNFQGVDCWTFFVESNWTPEKLLDYVELDRYRFPCERAMLAFRARVGALR
jgi:hypothetical protein